MSGKRTSVLLVIAAAGAALLAAPFIFAAGKANGDGCALGAGMHRAAAMHFGASGHRGHGAKMAALLGDLDLTAAQRESLHAIFERARERTAVSRQGVHGAFLAAAKTLAADPANVSGAKAALEARQSSVEALSETLVDSTAEAMAVLTPEQRARLVEHLERHAEAVPQ